MKLSILIPVRNDGINLKVMLKILKATVEVPHETLVVHDFPEDDSVPVVKAIKAHYPTAKTVRNTLGKGVINALRAGVEEAQGEFILIFAADEVGPVLAIEDMLHLMDQGCDFISCTRYAHGGRRLGGSIVGKMLSISANFIFHKILGGRLTDTTTGIKMFRRSIFKDLNLQAKPIGWAVVFEMAIKAQLLGLKLGEVPIISIDRLYGGKSTFHLRTWIWEYLRWLCWGAIQLRKMPDKKNAEVLVQLPMVGRIQT
jgi:glycosyltransferase involved in cell wall biosynthesis